MHQRKVQGFCGKTAKILALEQRIIALKALACKGFRVVQYTLYTGHYRHRGRRTAREVPFRLGICEHIVLVSAHGRRAERSCGKVFYHV